MRKVEQRLVQSIEELESYSSGNTTLSITDKNDFEVRLHGHLIVQARSLPSGLTKLRFSHCGWKTATTKSRLKAVLELYGITVKQRNGEWFYYTDSSKPHLDRPFQETNTLMVLR